MVGALQALTHRTHRTHREHREHRALLPPSHMAADSSQLASFHAGERSALEQCYRDHIRSRRRPRRDRGGRRGDRDPRGLPSAPRSAEMRATFRRRQPRRAGSRGWRRIGHRLPAPLRAAKSALSTALPADAARRPTTRTGSRRSSWWSAFVARVFRPKWKRVFDARFLTARAARGRRWRSGCSRRR